jgi:hypothetical protein
MKQPTPRLLGAFYILGTLLLSVGNIRADVVDSEMLLEPTDPHGAQNFGTSVAISGDTAVIGAPEIAGRIGAAYVYTNGGSNWIQSQKLVPLRATTNDLAGTSVAVDHDLLAIGAPGADLNPTTALPGFVYLYQRTNGVWFEQLRVNAPDAQRADRFGASIAISGQTLVVGSSLHSDFGSTNSGGIYVFDFTSLGWQLTAKLVPNDLTNSSNFGRSVSISGDNIIAGAGSITSGGAAYVFARRADTNFFIPVWQFDQKLLPSNPINGEQFGFSVAMDGDSTFVGAPFAQSGGSVYAFVRKATNWTQQTEIVSSNLTNGDHFGSAVAILGNRAVIGASAKASNDVSGLGAAYIFEQVETNWVEEQELLPLQSSKDFGFGFSVAVGTAGVLVGTPTATITNGDGAVYAFTSSQSVVTIDSALASPPALVPQNHAMIPVTISVKTTSTNVTSKIIDVFSNQPVIGFGGSATSPDWVITGDLTLQLRAEAADLPDVERVYSILIQSTDNVGNSTTTTVNVPVVTQNTASQ